MHLCANLLQDDYELEEFKALEQQIKKDVRGGLEQPFQVKVRSSSFLQSMYTHPHSAGSGDMHVD